jgi:predicted anti-sigma-YlaC factor YlaD
VHTVHQTNLLPDYVRETLDGDARRAVEQHLVECADCRGEVEALRTVIEHLGRERFEAPPTPYFVTLLPRIRMRLESRTQWSRLRSLYHSRFALPLATAGLIVALLLHAPFGSRFGVPLPLENLAAIDAGDVADLLFQQPGTALADVAQQYAVESIPADVINRQLAAQLSSMGNGSALSEWAELSTDQLLKDWSDDEVDILVQRLGERTILQ